MAFAGQLALFSSIELMNNENSYETARRILLFLAFFSQLIGIVFGTFGMIKCGRFQLLSYLGIVMNIAFILEWLVA